MASSLRERMVSSRWAFPYSDISSSTATKKQILKNMLREVNQKHILHSKQSQKFRKELRVPGTTLYTCPHCSGQVNQLTNAHVGPSVSSMIDKILAEHSDEDILGLFKKLQESHASTIFVICCRACNKLLEDPVDS